MPTAQNEVDAQFLLAMLQNILKADRSNLRDVWYQSYDNCICVANILNAEYRFGDTGDVIYFFEKPWKWETEMKELANELLGITEEAN